MMRTAGLSARVGGLSTELCFSLGAGATLFMALLLKAQGVIGTIGAAVAAGLYAVFWGVAQAGARTERLRSFGAANGITLARLALAVILAGCAAEIALGGRPPPESAVWLMAFIASAALASDALDGWIARRSGTATAFGARFDMETDAVLMLVLCVLAWMLGKAGAWILAAGLMRYVFVAAGLAWAGLAAPLRPSFRRKAVCVLQIGALILMLMPFLEPSASAMLGQAALTLLLWSFAVDTAWLLRSGLGTKRRN